MDHHDVESALKQVASEGFLLLLLVVVVVCLYVFVFVCACVRECVTNVCKCVV